MPFKSFGAHLPWTHRDQYLELILDLGLIPEVAFKAHDLDLLDDQALEHFARQLRRLESPPTVHAPFFDLNPGALDPLVRQATMKRLVQTLDLADRLGAHTLVIHPGFDPWRYPGMEKLWVNSAIDFFTELLSNDPYGQCRLAIENIYEPAPDTLVSLVEAIDAPRFGHCFDIGHWHMFGQTPLAAWLEPMLPRLFHVHLHDNHGDSDAHLPLGDGTIDFDALFTLLAHNAASPSMTLEAHAPADLSASLKCAKDALRKAGLL